MQIHLDDEWLYRSISPSIGWWNQKECPFSHFVVELGQVWTFVFSSIDIHWIAPTFLVSNLYLPHWIWKAIDFLLKMFNGIISFDFLVFDEQFKFNSVCSLCNFAYLIFNEDFRMIFILIFLQFVVSKKLNEQNRKLGSTLKIVFDVNVINVAL